jgi:hypothetical protein
VRTKQSYPAGTKLRVRATGTYLMRGGYRWVAADAECTRTESDYWRSTRLDGLFNGSTSPLGDLAVNGAIVNWSPEDGTGSCDRDNAYTYDLTTTKSGPLSFVVADDYHADNQGALEVEVGMQ